MRPTRDMPTDPISYTYEIRRKGSEDAPVAFTVTLDRQTLEHARPPLQNPPEWTKLDNCQCPCCPLLKEETESCPAAVSLVEILQTFDGTFSYDEVDVVVHGSNRTYSASTSLQRALSSLVGLFLPTSGCPVLGKFKPMARFHLPFSTSEETFFRSASAWLLLGYLQSRHKHGDRFDMDGLSALYKDLHEINVAMARRIRNATTGDAGLNAITLLDLFAQGMPMSIQENLRELDYLFAAAFPED